MWVASQLLLISCWACHAHLSTNGVHIVNASTGQRVRLKCVNWYGAHQEPLVPGGLEVTSADNIADLIALMGANCVRLPLSDQGVLNDPMIDPYFIMGRNASALQVLDTVVSSLTCRGLMVILNSHTTTPGWVGLEGAHEEVPQGLWHGGNISTTEWVRGLALVSARYSSNPLVIGIDIRNEIHDQGDTIITWGRSKDVDSDWLAAATIAEDGIAAVNPHMLIIVSGLCRAYDIRPLMDSPGPSAALERDKLVFSTHVYPFSWWWENIYWLWVMYVAIIVFIFSSLLLICVDTPPSFCCLEFNILIGSFLPFAVIWIAVACVKLLISRGVGCETLANESTYWIIAGVCLLLVSAASNIHLLLTEDDFMLPLVKGFLCWTRLLCVVVVIFSYVTGTYWMVLDDLRRWRLEARTVPVFVGEFGTVVGDNTVQWGYLNRVLHEFDLDFAYWAVNGRKWRNGVWETENYGLLNYNYSGLADKTFADTTQSAVVLARLAGCSISNKRNPSLDMMRATNSSIDSSSPT